MNGEQEFSGETSQPKLRTGSSLFMRFKPIGSVLLLLGVVLVVIMSLPGESSTNLKASPEPSNNHAGLPSGKPSFPSIQPVLDELDGYSCLDGSFVCVDLFFPLDHEDPENADELSVTFAVHPADGERKGMFVVAVGGPGGSGLAVADWYIWAYDPAILEQFDIVFFDQRGVGASGDLRCDEAAHRAYLDAWDPSSDGGAAAYQLNMEINSPEGEALMLEDYRVLAEECQAEVGRPELLPYVGTRQAIEDLELFRQAIGDEQFWLYGESYGSYFAQFYASEYPEHLAALILDGPIDPALSGYEFAAEQAKAFNDVLVMTLDACSADYFCREDMGGDALMAYDNLVVRLAEVPLPFEYPLASGGTELRYFGLYDLESAAASYMYSETARMIFLRSLAAAVSRDDLVPLARMLYNSLDVDPNTLGPVVDPGFTTAGFFAIECNDHDFSSIDEYLQAGKVVEESTARFASGFYSEMVCAYWLEKPTPNNFPEPVIAGEIPTLILVGTADPATPPANAERIFERLSEGYLITEEGGPHVLYGWGKPCIDSVVTEFLVDGRMPGQRRTTCEGVVVDEYFYLPPLEAYDFESPLEALWSADIELYFLPEYYYWDREEDLRVGCPFGGSFSIEPNNSNHRYEFNGCAFTPGFTMTGTGVYDLYSYNYRLNVEVTGYREGQLEFTRDADFNMSVTGEYEGVAIDLSG